MVLTGVLGHPVGHSRSPAMMNAAFRALGLDWRYFRLPVPPPLLVETVRALPASGYVAANVTIPHKLAALELADERTPAAEAIGAANSLRFRDGRIEAENTDAPGLLDALGETPPPRALVLGAGGGARAAVWALREAGSEVLVWNRTPERARALAADLGARALERPESAPLVVNATSLGLAREPEEEVLTRLGFAEPPGVLVDLVYGDEPTALCLWAQRAGARVVDGLEVLVRQGARSLERWTGRRAPLDVMREAARGSRGVSSTRR
jgi:shikimate dehydrogenase